MAWHRIYVYRKLLEEVKRLGYAGSSLIEFALVPSASINPAEQFGARVRRLRVSLGWSQTELGVRMGISDDSAATRISRYEAGKHFPDLETAHALAETLGVPLPALLAQDDELYELIVGFDKLKQSQRSALIARVRAALKSDEPR